MVCEICCWNGAERTVPGTIAQMFFKLTYIVYMLAVPIFLLWMIVATKPVDMEVFGPVKDVDMLKGNIALFDGGVEVDPIIPNVDSDMLSHDCGAPGMASWKLTVKATKPLAGAKLPVLLASDAMTEGKFLPPDSPKLKWHAVAQPNDFGEHAALSGPQFETDWLKHVGCHGQPKAPKLDGQDNILVCVSDHVGGASSVDDCDLVKAKCSGGMGHWFTGGGCTDGVLLTSRDGSYAEQSCEDTPLQPAGICKDPEDATDCDQCKEWGCKTPGTDGKCKVPYDLASCLKENPPSAHRNSFPEFKITIRSDEMKLVSKSVQIFVSDKADEWALLYSSSVDKPSASVHMSGIMAAQANPKWCFGPRSQNFYMVACLTSSSGANAHEWAAHSPPLVDGPPFNDRCSALLGFCGTIGTAADHSGLPEDFCSKEGFIPTERLVKLVNGRRNGGSFWFYGFIFFMILAHMSTLVTYFGGLFRTDYINNAEALMSRTMHMCTGWEELKRHRYAMSKVGALVIWGASKTEERLFILRNWVGRIASVPQWEGPCFGEVCRCVDVFMDEGHRVGARELWTAFVNFLDSRPPRDFLKEWSHRLRDFSFDDARTTARGQIGDPFKGLNWMLDRRRGQAAASAAAGSMQFRSMDTVEEEEAGFQTVAPAPMELVAPAGDRARPLVLQAATESEEREYGRDLSDESIEALCRLIETFRDSRLKENLMPKENGGENPDITRDVVIHRVVQLSEDCSLDCLYVARAREQVMPPAAFRTLAMQHLACLNLPSARIGDGQELMGERQTLAELVVGVAEKLLIAERHYQIIDTAGNEREVHPNNIWRNIVKIKDERLPRDPDAQVNMEWLERVNGRYLWRRGRVPRSILEEGSGFFKPMVPGVQDRSPWELGRLCWGKIVQRDNECVTLDGLSPLLEWFAHDKDFRRVACPGDPEDQERMFKLKRCFAAPLCGSRGKGGAQNFALQLLRNRGLLDPPPRAGGPQGPLSLGQQGRLRPLSSLEPSVTDGPRTGAADGRGRPSLFAIFDARHQPTPDYFKDVLPNFFRRNEEMANEYQLDPRVAFAQVPQTFSRLEIIDDSLDTNNGMMFNMLNLVRNNCGAVTSCGTNSTWQVESPESLPDEVFDARTKIEDTASSHKAFFTGRRSVYVNSKCVIGVAKRNARYLGAVARWSEGAVQLFWVTLVGDRNPSMIFMVCYKLIYLGLIFALLLFFSFRSADRYFICKKPDDGICGRISKLVGDPTGSTIHALEGAAIWGAVVIGNIILFELMRFTYNAAPIVRRIVMLDNLTYFWSTGAAFFWVLLNFYMIISGSIPFQYDIKTWMYWLLFIKVLQYILTYMMKSKGECQEASIWRSQQMFFVTAPLHQLSILYGTAGAFSIIWRGIDKSWWDTDNADQVLCLVKAWTTFIVGSAGVAIVAVALALLVNSWNVTSSICSATIILFFMALCVFDAFMDVWELNSSLQAAGKPGWAERGEGCCVRFRKCWSAVCRFLWHMRGWTWLVRWIMDFGMPIAVLCLIQRDSFGIAAAFSFILRL